MISTPIDWCWVGYIRHCCIICYNFLLYGKLWSYYRGIYSSRTKSLLPPFPVLLYFTTIFRFLLNSFFCSQSFPYPFFPSFCFFILFFYVLISSFYFYPSFLFSTLKSLISSPIVLQSFLPDFYSRLSVGAGK